MKSKNKGDVLIGFVFVLILVTITVLAYDYEHNNLSLEQVQELDKKCLAQQGETVLVLNSKANVNYVQCKKQGAVYDKF